jgi:dipeptidyl aminopeptidase/acylaminoacyl peptidase
MERVMKRFLCTLSVVVLGSIAAVSAQGARRPISLDDLGRLKEVRDPQCAPDGKSVAFVVSQIDVKEDKAGNGHIWMVGIDGQNERQITSSTDSESSPKFSPDGKYLSFTSSRPGKAKGNQVWLLDRSGGEAFQLTEIKGRLQGYEWSPDSKRLAVTIGDPDPDAPDPSTGAGQTPAAGGDAAGGRGKAPKPIVIDRYKYKQDGQGYLLSGRHTYIYLFDIASKKLERLTTGKVDEASPSWSPDGTRIAFTSNRNEDPDREPSAQLFVIDAKPGSTEKALTSPTSRGGRGKAEWSPDGKMDRVPRERREEVRRLRHGASGDRRGRRLEPAGAREGNRGSRPRRVVAAVRRGWQGDRRPRHRRQVRLSGARDARDQPRRPDVPAAGGGVESQHRRHVRGRAVGRRHQADRGLQGRWVARAGAAHASERRALLGASARYRRSGQCQEQGRHGGPRAADEARRLRRRHEDSDAAADPRRAEQSGSALVQLRAAMVRGQRLRRARRELSRQRRPRLEVLESHRRGLGPLRGGRSAGDGGSGS